MQRHILTLIICLLAVVALAQNKVQKSVPTIYVDAGGVMRWSDTKKEASFFGVNYTLPLHMPIGRWAIWEWTVKLLSTVMSIT